MGTITQRKRANGDVAYTSQIRLKRGGVVIHSEAQTFDRKTDATAWMKRRETELAAPGAIAALSKPDPKLGDVIDQYLTESDTVKKVGRTKKATLKAIAKMALGELKCSEVDSGQLVAFARKRITVDGAKPPTVLNDLALLTGVFAIAEPAWGFPLSTQEMDKAKAVCRQLGYIERADERTRVPTVAEMSKLIPHFLDASRRRPWVCPMFKIVPFALFSTRRMEEITHLRWDDINKEDKTIIVRDAKHPRKKIGNHLTASIPDEAWAIIESMPKVSDRIFPFTTDAIEAQFRRATDWLDIEDLHFHDLRRGGVTRLFEMGKGIPEVASVSLHKDWNMLRRYTNIKKMGDRYKGWEWLKPAIERKWMPKPEK